jgi:hypothetical protein
MSHGTGTANAACHFALHRLGSIATYGTVNETGFALALCVLHQLLFCQTYQQIKIAFYGAIHPFNTVLVHYGVLSVLTLES